MHIAVLQNGLRPGKTQGVLMGLAGELCGRGHRVDVVLPRTPNRGSSQSPHATRVVGLEAVPILPATRTLLRLPWRTLKHIAPALGRTVPKPIMRLSAMVRYLQESRPDVVLSAAPTLNLVALWAASQAGVDARVVVRQTKDLSPGTVTRKTPLQRGWPALTRYWYPRADRIVAVSNAVAEDLTRVAELPRERIAVIHDPIDMERIKALALEEVSEPWFGPGQPPVLVAVGKLVSRNDYSTLLRAVARVRATRDVRLVILGEGVERERLQKLVGQLEIANSVQMPGRCENPYKYMVRAAAVTYSAAWESFPRTLVEALSCGANVVSTDCHWGPADVLDHGAHGRLVPVANDKAFAAAVLAVLDEPKEPQSLRRRASEFALAAVADRYLKILSGRDDARIPRIEQPGQIRAR